MQQLSESSYMLSSDGADHVYPPAEDTHLLMDVLAADAASFAALGAPHCLCLELGIGSGAVSALIIKNYSVPVVGVDVNSVALVHASSAAPGVALVRADLVSALRPHVFDIVVFNPPYVPTDRTEMQRALRERDIAASWAGGDRGREVIDACLVGVRECLVDGGLFYLVLEKANVVQDVIALAQSVGLGEAQVLGRVEAGTERLCVVRFKALAAAEGTE